AFLHRAAGGGGRRRGLHVEVVAERQTQPANQADVQRLAARWAGRLDVAGGVTKNGGNEGCHKRLDLKRIFYPAAIPQADGGFTLSSYTPKSGALPVFIDDF